MEATHKGYIEKKEKGTGEYEDLYLEGIELLQKLSGAQWTDYNEHDPGVTIFENLAYTLTNLSYKADLPINDILTESKGSALESGDNGFFIASEILTTNPVIVEDFRKLLIDQIKNVKNVWIKLHQQLYHGASNTHDHNNLKGLYHIFIEVYDYKSNTTDWDMEQLRINKAVQELFHAHRNLCEDLYDVTIYLPLELQIKLNLTLDEHMNGEEVFAQIYYDINDYLCHEPGYNSLLELQENKYDINTIYNGPFLENGFIPDSELKRRIDIIVLSDITKLISKVSGVVSIDNFELSYKNTATENEVFIPIKGDMYIIPENLAPVLRLPKDNEDLLFKNAEVEFNPELREVQKQLSYIEARHYGNFKSVSQSANTLDVPDGEFLNIDSYYSVRNQFPSIYGIGHEKLTMGLEPSRYAQAKQLKAFLLPFDQLMSNFLAQLTNIYNLYDIHSDGMQSYFYKELEDMPELLELIQAHESETEEESLSIWRTTLKELNASRDINAIKRLNDVADNLLARYAEQFPAYVLRKISASCYGKQLTDEYFEKDLLKWKRKLIANYASLSYNRAKSFNYSLIPDDISETKNNSFNECNTPGIVQKIAILLGINFEPHKRLSEVITKADIQFSHEDTAAKRIKEAMYFPGNIQNILPEILRTGISHAYYYIQKTKERKKYHYDILFGKTASEGNKISRADSKRKAEERIKYAIHSLKKLSEQSEGIHLIEHLLLAPPVQEAYFGFTFFIEVDTSTFVDFEQARLQSNADRNKTLDKLLRMLSNKNFVQFQILNGNSGYQIEITTNGKKVLARSTTTYKTEAAANGIINAMKAHMECDEVYELKDSRYFAHYENDKVDERFFSFRMSFILPSWPVRFQNYNFRTQFNNILYQHAPVHLAYETFWLELNKMIAFEEDYFEWLKLLPNKDLLDKRIALSYKLITKIQDYHRNS